MAIALAATAICTISLAHFARDRDLQAFKYALADYQKAFEGRLDAQRALLRATAGVIEAHGEMSRAEFARYVEALQIDQFYPGLLGLGYAKRVEAADLPALLRAQQDQGYKKFEVWPDDARHDYFPIVRLEPLDNRNRAALGYDMFTEARRRRAMEHARDSGRAAATESIVLVQEIGREKQRGFLIYLAVYEGGATPGTVEERRARLKGFVYSPFRGGDLFRGLFPADNPGTLRVAIYSGSAPTEEGFLFSNRVSEERPYLTERVTMERVGQAWTLVFEASPALVAASSRDLVPLTLFVGLAVSGLLGWLTWQQTRSRLVAESSERARLASEEELRLHSRVLESMTEGVSVATEQGKIVYTNPAEDEMFGYPRGELIGQHVSVQNAYPEAENRRRVEEVIAKLKTVGEFQGEWMNRRKDGSVFYTYSHISAIRRQGRNYWVCVQHDITHRKLLEQEREALLESERAARGEAERIARMKDEFLATLSHELRTPLTAILGWVSILEHEGIEEADKKEGLETIARNARAQTRLIEDLLDMNRIISGQIRLEMQSLDLAQVIQQAIGNIRPLADGKCLHLELSLQDAAPRVFGDPHRLQQVFWNLLTNAVKFTAPGGRISLGLTHKQGQVRVAVVDTGQGVDPAFIPFIFDRFSQADSSTTRRHGGLGLGLSIVKSLVDLHGGRVEVKSEGRGKGTSFVITLPVTTEREAPREAPKVGDAAPLTTESVPPSLAGAKVVLIEDDADTRAIIHRVLRAAGAEVTCWDSAQRALEAVQQAPVDIIISDIGMPEMDGYEFISRLRALPPPWEGFPPSP